MTAKPTRGERNNNPGNIERDGDKWQGMSATQPDKRFASFIAPEYGIRAIAVTLLTYDHRYHLNTISKVIDRWAPPKENDTQAYKDDAAAQIGKTVNTIIDLDDAATMKACVIAIIKHENGRCIYDDATITKGLALAGVHGAPLPTAPVVLPPAAAPIHKQPGVRGGIAVVGAACVDACTKYVPVVKDTVKTAVDNLTPFHGSVFVANIEQGLLTVGGLAAVVWVGVQVYNRHRFKEQST